MITMNFLGLSVTHSVMRFSGGETQVRIEHPKRSIPALTIRADIFSGDDLMELLLVTDAARRMFGAATPISLVMPYLPYARQDRVCAEGEALSLKVFCSVINAQNYAGVEVWDAHSDVAMALLDRAWSVGQAIFVSRIAIHSEMLLVAPDAGAMKKIAEVSKAIGVPYIRADKTRDPATGAITGTVVYADDLGGADVLIVDDICDGGRTFIELAAELRKHNPGRIWLYVTHGIFSRGVEALEDQFDRIFCPNVFPSVRPHPLLERL